MVFYLKDFGLLQFAYDILCEIIEETFPDSCSVDIIETKQIDKGMAAEDDYKERRSPVRELIKMFERISRSKQKAAKPSTQNVWRQKKTGFVMNKVDISTDQTGEGL